MTDLADLGATLTTLRAAYCRETSELPISWTPEHPSTGQCHVTALILQRKYGGAIMRALKADTKPHYWNVIDGITIDATRDQFPFGAVVSAAVDATEECLNHVTEAKRDLLGIRAFGQILVG